MTVDRMTNTLLSRFESLKHLRDGPAVWQWAQEAADEIERQQKELASSAPCPHIRFVAGQDDQHCADCGLSAVAYQQMRHTGTLTNRRTDEPHDTRK